jgi:hypothetical protein
MTSIMFGQMQTELGVPADEKVVRNTATPVDVNAPAAEQDDMPEQQELETDPNPTLGMSPRQMASHWIEGSRATPDAPGSYVGQNASNQVTAAQVASSGTAAAREAAGQTHKNLSYAVGIEPVQDLADPNHKMGNTYFVRNQRNVQQGSGEYMTVPPGMGNPGTIENLSQAGKDAARQAAQSSPYDAFWNGGQQI